MNSRKNGLLVLGIVGLLFGIWMSFAGFAETTSDQYKEEVAFNGVYGSETVDQAYTMIGVGLVIFVVGVIMIVYSTKKPDGSEDVYEVKNSTEQFKKTDYNPNSLTYKQESNAIEEASSPIAPLLRRTEIFLEDGDFNSANEYYNRILDIDPECAKAYMGLVLSEQKFKDINELACSGLDITESGNYKKALRFADITYKRILEDLDPLAFERKENKRKESIYNEANRLTEVARSSKDYIKACKLFESISGYKDADQQIIKCNELIKDLKKAEEEERIKAKREEAERLEQARIAEMRTKKIRKVSGISLFSLLSVSTVIIVVVNLVIPWCNYSSANNLLINEQYFEAAQAFSKLGDFRDSAEKSDLLFQKLSSLISTDMFITVGLKKDGTVVAIGDNSDGQCDVSSWEDIVAISASYTHTVGLKNDGTVVTAGYNGFELSDVSLWKDIVAISAGSLHTVGLKKDGTVVAVGNNSDGQCDVSSWEDIVAISANWSQTVGLKEDGRVVAAGDNEDGQCDVSSWNDIVTISTKDHQTVGLKKDGTVVAVGNNEYGQCDVSLWKDIVAISAGTFHTVGLKQDGTVVAIGDNSYGQCDVSAWKDIVSISANQSRTVGLKKDGTVVATGDNSTGACDVSDWKDLVAIYAGETQTIGLKKDGTVVAVGSNLEGECDVSDWSDITLSEDMYNFGK